MKRLHFLLLAAIIISCAKEPVTGNSSGNADSIGSACAALNSNIKALNSIASAGTSGKGIKACLPQKSGKGYALMFTDGESASISTAATVVGNGDGQTSGSPVVGIRKTPEGFLWTIDGRSTERPAGIPGAMPEFRPGAEGVDLYMGEELLGQYSINGKSIASFLKDISSEDGKHTLHFIDGTTLTFTSSGSADIIPPQQATGTVRRSISPQNPMWIVHIDTWLHPDPQKVIDLIPSDILPYVVFNISLSVDGDRSTGEWKKVEYAYETAKSWLRTCAMNRVWAMIQPASGAYCHFKDTETYDEISDSLYAEFFRDYPNFIGFNYCEQFWGFGEQHSVTYRQRLVHWANLMRLTHEYGGYLTISCCGPYYAASMNPVAMIKDGGEFADMCRAYPENLIICEKYTSKYGFFNNESACLGMWLSGLAGHYGIRYDTCGWNETPQRAQCPLGAGIMTQLEHIMLTGETVIDGPELIREECYTEVSEVKTADGYTSRKWEIFPQFENISIDLFRKIMDGTVCIPEKRDVIDKTGIILIHDINSGSDREKYTAPAGMYEGLYQMDDDGDLLDNRSWFKKTGRYPSIPYAAELNGAEAQMFRYRKNISEMADRESRLEEMNSIFPEEYTGDIYAGRMKNGWVTYNPYRQSRRAEGTIPLKLNSCREIKVSHPEYSAAVIREFPDRITAYLNNYDTFDTSLKEDIITVYGAEGTPSVTCRDRGNHAGGKLQTGWEGEAFVISVSHNGPVDIEIVCSGKETGKDLTVSTGAVSAPARPDEYFGECQFEAENFDYKNISSIVRNGYDGDIRNYTGQGYMNFGSRAGAAARISFSQNNITQCALVVKYISAGAGMSSLDLYVNGILSQSLQLSGTGNGEWNTHYAFIELTPGANTLEVKTSEALKSELIIDNFVLIPVRKTYS